MSEDTGVMMKCSNAFWFCEAMVDAMMVEENTKRSVEEEQRDQC